MELTLQELVDAASRDLDARDARRQRRVRNGRSVPRVSPSGAPRVARAVPAQGEERKGELRSRPAPAAQRAPIRRYVFMFAAVLVLTAAGSLALAWTRASAAWEDEARVRQRELILQQGMALHGQINTLARQAERLEQKARTLLEYSADLRFSSQGRAGDREIEQADAALADRKRLLGEIAARRRQIAELGRQSAALHARP